MKKFSYLEQMQKDAEKGTKQLKSIIKENRKSLITAENFWKQLNDCEVNSLTFEGCIYINGKTKQVIRDGEVVKINVKQMRLVWDEYCWEEGITQELTEMMDEIDKFHGLTFD